MAAAERAAFSGPRNLWDEAQAAEEKLRSAMPWPWQTANHAELRPAFERAKSVGVSLELLREVESKLKVAEAEAEARATKEKAAAQAHFDEYRLKSRWLPTSPQQRFAGAPQRSLSWSPLVATEVDIDVGGIVARATVKQYFVNPTKDWLEGCYVFPLPENAAVDRMKMVIGERVIEARIAERIAARRAYEAVKKSGRRAALGSPRRGGRRGLRLRNN